MLTLGQGRDKWVVSHWSHSDPEQVINLINLSNPEIAHKNIVHVFLKMLARVHIGYDFEFEGNWAIYEMGSMMNIIKTF